MKMKSIITVVVFSTSICVTSAHALIPVVAWSTDIMVQLQGMITNFKRDYQWAIDLQNKTKELMNDYTTIQNQMTQIQQQYDAVKNFDTNSINGFLDSIKANHQRIEGMMQTTQGILNASGNLEDNMQAFIPRIEGMSQLSPSQWHDFFEASEKQKQYSVKNAIRDYDQIRKNHLLINAKERELQDKNNNVENSVQAISLTNNILLQQQEVLKNLNTQLGNQAMLAATAATAADNSQKTINAEAKRVMSIQSAPVSSKGAGLFQLD